MIRKFNIPRRKRLPFRPPPLVIHLARIDPALIAKAGKEADQAVRKFWAAASESPPDNHDDSTS